MITIIYVTTCNQYFIKHEKSGDEKEIFEEAIDKNWKSVSV